MKINRLTTTEYAEEKITSNPIIKASSFGWNANAMHHIDPVKISENNLFSIVSNTGEEALMLIFIFLKFNCSLTSKVKLTGTLDLMPMLLFLGNMKLVHPPSPGT